MKAPVHIIRKKRTIGVASCDSSIFRDQTLRKPRLEDLIHHRSPV